LYTSVAFLTAFGVGWPTAASGSSSPASGGLFVVTNAVVLDTTHGVGGPLGQMTAGAWRTVQIDGVGDIPTTGVGAISVVLTASGSTTQGRIAATGSDSGVGSTSFILLNYPAGASMSNSAIVQVSSSGTIGVYANTAVDLTIAVNGYYTTGDPAAGGFVPLSPAIVASSITGTGGLPAAEIANGSTYTVAVGSTGDVPADAAAVELDGSETNPSPSSSGQLVIGPGGGGADPSKNQTLTWATGDSSAWSVPVVLPSASLGNISLGVAVGGSVNVQLVVEGYFVAANGTPGTGTFIPCNDGVWNTNSPAAPLSAGASATIPVAGAADIPQVSVSAAILNIRVTNPSTDGHLRVYDDDDAYAPASVFFTTSQTSSTLVLVPLGKDGGITIENTSGATVSLNVAAEGYFVDGQADPAEDSYQMMVSDLTAQGLENEADLVDYRTWLNGLSGLDSSGFYDEADDIASRTATLLWDGSSPLQAQALTEAANRGINAVVRAVPYTKTAVSDAANALVGQVVSTSSGDFQITTAQSPIDDVDGNLIDHGGLQIEGYYETQADNRAAVESNAPDLEAAVQAISAMPVAAVGYGEPTDEANFTAVRTTDYAPFYAGGLMADNLRVDICSSGFTIVVNGSPHVSTARHCIYNRTYADYTDYLSTSPPANHRYGTLYETSGEGEGEVLTGYGTYHVFDGAWNNSSGYNKVVAAVKDVSIGDHVCTDGGFSGVHCGLQVVGTEPFNDGYGTTWSFKVQASAGIAGAAGDSGGPVLIPLSGGTHVWAVGMIQGSREAQLTSGCGPMADSHARCSRWVEFTEISEIAAGLRGYVLTGP